MEFYECFSKKPKKFQNKFYETVDEFLTEIADITIPPEITSKIAQKLLKTFLKASLKEC